MIRRSGSAKVHYYGRAESPYRKDRNPAQSGVTVRLGFNSRMDTLQCAALRVFLRHHEEILERRRAIARVYDNRLSGTHAVLPVVPPEHTHAYRVYVVRVPDRDRVLHELHRRGIQAGLHYIPPNHLHPYYRRQGHRPGEFPVAERVADELLCLPCHPYMTTAQVEEVADTLKALIAV